MATVFGTNSNNTLIVEGDDLLGLAGDDTYVVTNALANHADNAGRTIVITDTEGTNRLQLADGLQIAAIQFLGGNALQVTLTNNLRIQVVGADRFNFDIGGNAAANDTNGLIGRSFAQLASDFGVTLTGGAGMTAAPVTVQPGANPLGPATPPATVFSLSATVTTVQEGVPSLAVYTVTASAPVAVATTVTFSLRPGNAAAADAGTGSTNNNDFAGAAFNAVQVVIPAGGTTASFTVPAPLADGLSELNENFVVQAVVDGNTLSANGTLLDALVGFQTVVLSGNVTGVNGVAESFVLSYQLVAGRATNVAGGGTYNITGFNGAEDRLVFDNVGSSTPLTEAQVRAVPGVSISENPFQSSTLLLLDPLNGVQGGVVLVGIVDAALNTVNLVGG